MPGIAIKALQFIRFHKWLYQYVKFSKATTVLCFHRVNDFEDPAWPALKTENYKALLNYVVKHYSVIDLSEIKTKTRKPELVISFDDGYYDFMENALPVLQKMKLPGNMNIVTNCAETGELIWTQRLNNILNFLKGHNQKFLFRLPQRTIEIDFTAQKLFYFKNSIQTELYNYSVEQISSILAEAEHSIPSYAPSKNDKMMRWDDVVYCSNNGVHIGSHTQTHGSLKEVADGETLHRELVLSKQIIEDKIKKAVDTIAYPNGQYNEKVIASSLNAGYKNLLLVDSKLFYQGRSKPLPTIPRLLIHHNEAYTNLLITSGITHFR